ncbi:pyridoxamine 5'-phosphate oxidase [Rhizobium sp. Leaf384]|uniref:HugZ family pyridoxamine 5'-phosphate oxidase n=1 Tax=unclassified Rhizobium TaxID=2613769 RepID=UPI0007155FA0|nr:MULTISPECIES: HugZ family protein [unclassified Rhizobium]KQS76931.1 pyridoxamine 5'-phosphate oxidase [Rhizobium sp. Leaf384]KQS78202.1 pyridoxamine 5'-phosphate oxidase [Rhizobium sp. Leaf383]
MAEKPQVLRETDDAARKLARLVFREQRSAAIGVLEPVSDGFPFVSRALLGFDIDAVPIILASQLATHTQALLADARCSVLAGRSGKGDPLAHARITVQCRAEPIARTDLRHARLRERFLRRHPKAQLYIDFPDFLFFRLNPLRASLNAGFGRAYALTGDDLLISSAAMEAIAAAEHALLAELNSNKDALSYFLGEERSDVTPAWQVTAVDAEGIDLVQGDAFRRADFPREVENPDDVRAMFVKLYR